MFREDERASHLQGVPSEILGLVRFEERRFGCVAMHIEAPARITPGIIRAMRKLVRERSGGDTVYAVCVPRGSQAARLAELAGLTCKHPYRAGNLTYTSC